jgi:hypothetical protein
MKWNNWTAATKRHYGFDSLSELQLTWVDWVRRGSPPLQPKAGPSSPLQGAAAIAQAASGGEGGPGTASAGRSTPAETTGSSGDSLVPVPRIASSQTRGDDSSGSVQAGETVATRQEHGWYARQRDRALAGRGRSASASFVRVATSAAGFHELNPPDNTTAVEQQLIRPQPMGRPQQVIVEWGPPPGRPSPPAPTAYSPSLPAPPPPSRFDAPVGQAATVWR